MLAAGTAARRGKRNVNPLHGVTQCIWRPLAGDRVSRRRQR